jgi:excisionase family DNA binding protein
MRANLAIPPPFRAFSEISSKCRRKPPLHRPHPNEDALLDGVLAMADSSPGPLEPILAAFRRIEERLDGLERTSAPPSHLTVEEFARRVGRAPFTVRQWCNHRRIRADRSRNGRQWRIPADELARYRREGLMPADDGASPGRLC